MKNSKNKMLYKSYKNLFEKLTSTYNLQLKINFQLTYKTYMHEK